MHFSEIIELQFGYPQFSFWICITLAKICFSHIFINRTKILRYWKAPSLNSWIIMLVLVYHIGEKEDNLFDIFVLFLAQREEGRLNNEIRRINNEIKDLTEKRNILEVREITCISLVNTSNISWFGMPCITILLLFYPSFLISLSFYYQNNIFRNTQRLEDLKSQMNWDQKALEAWLEESARKDEDALTLQKYTRSDEGKVKVSSLLTV